MDDIKSNAQLNRALSKVTGLLEVSSFLHQLEAAGDGVLDFEGISVEELWFEITVVLESKKESKGGAGRT